jgi:predicted RNA binding protein YcfA (HicA-like mRNA interferase family)
MSQWPSSNARAVLGALLPIGWSLKGDVPGSHRMLSRPGWPDYTLSFHDREEIGPRMLARIAKRTAFIQTISETAQPVTPPDTLKSLAPVSFWLYENNIEEMQFENWRAIW